MGVATHLGIRLEEYDALIRTFIPDYEAMLAAAAGTLATLRRPGPTVVDLGVGTGALAAACRGVRPEARLIGIDADPAVLELAAGRLGSGAVGAGTPATGPGRVDLVAADFLAADLPEADAFVASLALHHVRTAAEKRAFYGRVRRALRPGGVLVSADRFPSRDAAAGAREREAWLAHLERSHGRERAEGFLAEWAGEDVYFPLEDEVAWLEEAGLTPRVVWRRDGFAVVAAAAP